MIRFLLILALLCSSAYAENWNGYFGGGARRNYSPTGIAGELTVAWQRGYDNYPDGPVDKENSGRTVNCPLVRDGKVWHLNNSANPEIVIYSLTDGSEISRYKLSMYSVTSASCPAGRANTDIPGGLWWAFGPDNSLIVNAGGDWSDRYVCNADTGEKKTFWGIDQSALGRGPNAVATFNCDPTSKIICVGGSGAHSDYDMGARMHHLTRWLIQDYYGSFGARFSGSNGLTENNIGYMFGTHNWMREGFRIIGNKAMDDLNGKALPTYAGYQTNEHTIYGVPCTNGYGRIRPICMLPDGRIAYLAYYTKRVQVSSFSYVVPDSERGSVLVVLDGKPSGAVQSHAYDVNCKFASMSKLLSVSISGIAGDTYYPQIMASNDVVSVFIPPSGNISRLISVDTGGRVIVDHTFDAGYLKSNCSQNAWNQLLAAAVQAKMVGDSIYIFETSMEPNLSLRVIRVPLATGKPEAAKVFELRNQAGTSIARADIRMIKDVACTDGTLTALVQWRASATTGVKTNQVLCVLRGSTNPPQPPQPPTPEKTPEQRVLDFAKPILDSTKYEAIERVLR